MAATTQTLHMGYDVRTPDPGEHSSMTCMTCGSVMDVQRNVMAATGSAEAMSGRAHLHDRFTCPNAGREWHNQIIRLMQEQRDTASETIKRILQNEINAVLRRNQSAIVKVTP